MPRALVNSQALASAAYDPEAQVFELQYVGGKGHVYRYHHVPHELYADFVKAYSLGAFISMRVKPYFPCERLTLAEAAARPLLGAGPAIGVTLEGGYTRRRKERRRRSARPRSRRS